MLLQDYYKVEQEFTTLEVGVRGFQVVAGLSPAEVDAFTTDSQIPKILYAIGVYVVIFTYQPIRSRGVQSGPARLGFNHSQPHRSHERPASAACARAEQNQETP